MRLPMILTAGVLLSACVAQAIPCDNYPHEELKDTGVPLNDIYKNCYNPAILRLETPDDDPEVPKVTPPPKKEEPKEQGCSHT